MGDRPRCGWGTDPDSNAFETAAKMKLGKVDGAEVWTPVADGDEGNYRFFKVGVGMPR